MKHGSRIMKHTLWRRELRGAALALVAIAMLLATTTANAGCGSRGGSGPSAAVSLPALAGLTAAPDGTSHSIVGLWHVTYKMADGSFYYESYDTWHSDGTEWESANMSPLLGNICEGVWKQAGRAVHLQPRGLGVRQRREHHRSVYADRRCRGWR
jgi:hypothetical protein